VGMSKQRAQPEDFREIYEAFRGPLSRFDCGKHCAPLNGGEPVCCTTRHAIPVVHKTEWELLRSRSDLWHRYRPTDAHARKIVGSLARTCAAIECKGAAFCERDNRSLACRAFPFAPYVTREREFIGLAYYWIFEDRCWVISNLAIVEPGFVAECVAAYERLFGVDQEEFETYCEHSAQMRRIFSRWRRAIPLIARDGGFLAVKPHGGGIVPADPAKFRKHGPYRSAKAYARAVRDAGGTPPEADAL
jgi:hypothetical protein